MNGGVYVITEDALEADFCWLKDEKYYIVSGTSKSGSGGESVPDSELLYFLFIYLFIYFLLLQLLLCPSGENVKDMKLAIA